MDAETKRLVGQKKELFEYVYKKYFNQQDTKGLGKYLDEIRKTKLESTLGDIRKGLIAPDKIDDYVEGQVTRAFLDRMLARVIVKRLPSKIIAMDRDRLSKDGVSRYRVIMKEMGLEGKFDEFDNIMQDMILSEQMMRKNVSAQMNKLRDADAPKEDYGKISYEMNPDAIRQLLAPLIGKGMMTQARLDNVLKLFETIQKKYGSDDAFINKDLVPFFRHGGAQERDSKYTIALDETDLSFIPFRAGGESVLARSIRDIDSVDQNVSKPITQLVGKLREMAINGKKDFGPILEIITKVHGAMDGIIGITYANELASKLAAMTVMYMKKDTQARALYGIFGANRFNSMAAESAGKKVGVWEWDSSEIDRFYTALEARGLVPPNPYNIGQEPTKEPLYINVPFVKNPIRMPFEIETSKIAELFGGEGGKLPFKIFGQEITIPNIPLFQRLHHDYPTWSKQEREKYGGTKFDMMFDILNKYLPMFLVFILISQIKKAFEDSEGKKK
jgi:hypothetical protein